MDGNRVLLMTSVSPENLKAATRLMPLAHLYLGASLEAHFEVRVFDAYTLNVAKGRGGGADRIEAGLAEIDSTARAALGDFRPFLVGLNCLFSGEITQTVRLAKLVKDFDPAIKVAVGGLHPTIFSDDIIRECPAIDFVLQGEGDRSALELALALKNGAGLAEVDGLTWRAEGGRVVSRPKARFIENLDSLPRPAYHLFDFEKYRRDTSSWHNPKSLELGVTVPVITSRSCPNRCNFCAMFRVMGPKFRARSAELVLDEWEYLYHEYGVRQFHIMDDNFTLDRKRALAICRGLVKRSLNINLIASNGLSLHTLDREMVEALAEAGLIWTYLAIESGSPFIRNEVMGKKLTEEKIQEVVDLFNIYRRQIITGVFLIIGLPEDDDNTLGETRRLIEALDVDTCLIHLAVPFPGTRLYQQCLREGLLLRGEQKWDTAEVFTHDERQGAAGDVFIRPRALSVERLLWWRAEMSELRLKKTSDRWKRLFGEA